MRDLIDVPVVETVVRLGDAEDSSQGKVLVRDFVLTRQVEANLRSMAQSLRENQGKGFFLVGPYGSGKSHFLSYVSLVASGETTSTGAECPLSQALDQKKLLPIRLPLVTVRGQTALETALLGAMESSLGRAGRVLPLTRRSRFVEHVDRSIRPLDPVRMDRFLADQKFSSWEILRRDPSRAAEVAWAYFKTLEAPPPPPEDSPDALIAEGLEAAGSLGYAGLLIVIDELSEFLRSKPSRQALNEDARYPQLLGEMARTRPLWILASLQGTIEQTGDIARDVVAKIKDRYPVRLSLDERHLRELIDGRLVRKKNGARESLRPIWQNFRASSKGFDLDFEDFFRIYPVHPATIRYLEGLGSLFSSHRGVVDFIVSQVQGARTRSVRYRRRQYANFPVRPRIGPGRSPDTRNFSRRKIGLRRLLARDSEAGGRRVVRGDGNRDGLSAFGGGRFGFSRRINPTRLHPSSGPGAARAVENACRRGLFTAKDFEMNGEGGPGASGTAGLVERLAAVPVIEMLKKRHPRFLAQSLGRLAANGGPQPFCGGGCGEIDPVGRLPQGLFRNRREDPAGGGLRSALEAQRKSLPPGPPLFRRRGEIPSQGPHEGRKSVGPPLAPYRPRGPHDPRLSPPLAPHLGRGDEGILGFDIRLGRFSAEGKTRHPAHRPRFLRNRPCPRQCVPLPSYRRPHRRHVDGDGGDGVKILSQIHVKIDRLFRQPISSATDKPSC